MQYNKIQLFIGIRKGKYKHNKIIRYKILKIYGTISTIEFLYFDYM